MNAWIFDVDGVITNPLNKRVTNPEILNSIVKKLEQGEVIALNTGLSAERMKEQVIYPLIQKIKNKNILQNFLIIAEKGGIRISFDQNNNMIENRDHSLIAPPKLQQAIRDLIDKYYSDVVFFDESKTTMMTAEVKDGYPLDKFEQIKTRLFTDIDSILKTKNLSKVFRAIPTTLDVDIENIKAGKDFATRKIFEWIENEGIKPQKFIAFGDSFKSDILMAQEIYSQRLPVEFVYVGEENIDTSGYSFPIKQTKNKYDKGTLEFLESL